MKKLILSLIIATSLLSCTKNLPDDVRIYVDISEASVNNNGFWTSDHSLIYRYYDKTVSRATFKNAIIVDNPNYADYIIKLEIISTEHELVKEYKANRTFYLNELSVTSQARLYDGNGNYLAQSNNSATAKDDIEYNEEANQYYVDETYKNYSDLTSTSATHNTNNFIREINDHKGF